MAAFTSCCQDHGDCIAHALSLAEAQCHRVGARLTPVRRRVLELIWQNHAAVGAYNILQQLAQDGFNAAPPTVYRALDFLLAHGLIHKIERLNAFIGCTQPGTPHTGQFLLCQECGATLELVDAAVEQALNNAAQRLGFALTSQVVELTGLCPACQLKHQNP